MNINASLTNNNIINENKNDIDNDNDNDNNDNNNLISWECDQCKYKNTKLDNIFECEMCSNKRNTNDLNKIMQLVCCHNVIYYVTLLH